jgi:hypothetical protein
MITKRAMQIFRQVCKCCIIDEDVDNRKEYIPKQDHLSFVDKLRISITNQKNMGLSPDLILTNIEKELKEARDDEKIL